MLVLSRKIDESIVIDGGITVVVLGVERDRVKLGISAPSFVHILREELVEDPYVPPLPPEDADPWTVTPRPKPRGLKAWLRRHLKAPA